MIRTLIDRIQKSYGIAIGFVVYDGIEVKKITYKQFVEDILETAAYFTENQIEGKHIAIIGENSYRWIIIFFAIIATGNIAILLNPALPIEMLNWQCEKTDINLICCSDVEIYEKLNKFSAVTFEVVFGNTPINVQDIYQHKKDETMMMLFTSGTTGKSKAVMLSSQNLFVSSKNLFSSYKTDDDERICGMEMLTLPFYHIGPIRIILNSLLNKGTLAIGRGTQYLFLDLPKLNPTHVGMVPSMAESLAKIMRGTPKENLIRYVGNNFKGIIAVGASMKDNIAQFLLEQGFNIDVLYGMTESAGDGSGYKLDIQHIGSIGKTIGNIEFKIKDGEILIRSESVMKGYYKDLEETEKVIVDGWLYTGDMGYCDEDGYYYITGRKKNVIILSNGENVNPEEIEVVLKKCETIEECLVYSDGKGICVDIYTNNRLLTAEFIKNYNASVPMYRQIYKINYTVEPLPKTGTGKIKRKENI